MVWQPFIPQRRHAEESSVALSWMACTPSLLFACLREPMVALSRYVHDPGIAHCTSRRSMKCRTTCQRKAKREGMHQPFRSRKRIDGGQQMNNLIEVESLQYRPCTMPLSLCQAVGDLRISMGKDRDSRERGITQESGRLDGLCNIEGPPPPQRPLLNRSLPLPINSHLAQEPPPSPSQPASQPAT